MSPPTKPAVELFGRWCCAEFLVPFGSGCRNNHPPRLPLTIHTNSRFLALGRGSRHRIPALEAVQREALELWRCCLSYGIDVAASDTVVLVGRGQGWLPGLGAAPPAGAGAAAADVGGGGGGGGEGGSDGGGRGDGNDGGVGSTSPPPRLAFYRALHQLACACVVPPGGNPDRANGAAKGAAAGDGPETAARSLGGVAVVPESWADVGDTVDAAVEAAILWLSSGSGGGVGGSGVGGGGAARTVGTSERALQVRGRMFRVVVGLALNSLKRLQHP